MHVGTRRIDFLQFKAALLLVADAWSEGLHPAACNILCLTLCNSSLLTAFPTKEKKNIDAGEVFEAVARRGSKWLISVSILKAKAF